MELNTLITAAIAVLFCGTGLVLYGRKMTRRLPPGPSPSPSRTDIALRDSAAFALSAYWARCDEGWTLAVFRDAGGVIRHIACELPDGTYFDARGRCSEEQVGGWLGVQVRVAQGGETDVQPLLGSNAAVLEAADELRRSDAVLAQQAAHGGAQPQGAAAAGGRRDLRLRSGGAHAG